MLFQPDNSISVIRDWYNPVPDEEVLHISRPSFIRRSPRIVIPMLTGISIAVLFFYLFFTEESINAFLYVGTVSLLGGVGWGAFELWRLKNHHYVITTKRVIEKTDIFGETTVKKTYDDIVNIDTSQSFSEVVISKIADEELGNITCRTADDTQKIFSLDDVVEFELMKELTETYESRPDITKDELNNVTEYDLYAAGIIQPETTGQTKTSEPATSTEKGENFPPETLETPETTEQTKDDDVTDKEENPYTPSDNA